MRTFTNYSEGDVAEVKKLIDQHISLLDESFSGYFSDSDLSSFESRLLRTPFSLDPEQIPLEAEAEYYDLIANQAEKSHFHDLGFRKFWLSRLTVYKRLASLAVPLLLIYLTTYLCEKAFSAVNDMKSKKRNRNEIQPAIIARLSSYTPRVELLARNAQR